MYLLPSTPPIHSTCSNVSIFTVVLLNLDPKRLVFRKGTTEMVLYYSVLLFYFFSYSSGLTYPSPQTKSLSSLSFVSPVYFGQDSYPTSHT